MLNTGMLLADDDYNDDGHFHPTLPILPLHCPDTIDLFTVATTFILSYNQLTHLQSLQSSPKLTLLPSYPLHPPQICLICHPSFPPTSSAFSVILSTLTPVEKILHRYSPVSTRCR